MKNKWKIGFLALLGINLLVAIIVFSLALSPPKETKNNKSATQSGEYVSFHVNSNKYDLNKLINHYLQEEASGSAVDYRVVLGDEVELYGTLPVFNDKVNMKLTFEPDALNNGDLRLRQKSMSIGRLPIPISYVLRFISENYKLPNGVEIKSDDQMIYVHMQQLKLKSDMKIKADKFDLKKDDIAFTILVPVK
ncbi:YpmS family protein [Neobacillus dielmonensis]|uniref:YpmS family protein n=1 Tax=Neobacillus dielmonensis TaxID=1347369 RepID=UPI0005A9788C|nr:YpmS family protein [Neobacillus dielmonensis]